VNDKLLQPPVKTATRQRTHKKTERPYEDTTHLTFGSFVF
jgi:hypothetical protein